MLAELAKKDEKLASLKAEKARLERERIVEQVAARTGLPDYLKNRLIGDNEEDLQEDALSLVKELTARKVPTLYSKPPVTDQEISQEELSKYAFSKGHVPMKTTYSNNEVPW